VINKIKIILSFIVFGIIGGLICGVGTLLYETYKMWWIIPAFVCLYILLIFGIRWFWFTGWGKNLYWSDIN